MGDFIPFLFEDALIGLYKVKGCAEIRVDAYSLLRRSKLRGASGREAATLQVFLRAIRRVLPHC